MQSTKEQIATSVLGAILHADKYINTPGISAQTNIAEDEVNEAINLIKEYNGLFLDTHGNLFNEGLINARVPEFFRDEVRKFLDDGGFISISEKAQLKVNEEPEQQDFSLQSKTEIKEASNSHTIGKKAKDILKAAGLIALITVLIKKSKLIIKRKFN